MNKKLPKIALGTWSWGIGMIGGDQVFGNSLDLEDIKPVFNKAMEEGLNLFDTAVAYGMGASEQILGDLVKEHSRDEVIISTKFTPQIAEEVSNPVETMLEGSLNRFDTDYIDIYWIHNPHDVERWTPYLAPLVNAGKIGRIGVSNHNLEQIKRANEILNVQGVSISAVQNHYSLLYRSSEEAGILDYCKENDIQFFAYMVLEQGALSGKYTPSNPMPAESQRGQTYNPLLSQIEELTSEMKVIGDKHDVSVSQIAMAWAIAKGATPIIGVTKVEQVEDAANASKVMLTEEEMSKLEQVAKQAGVDTRGGWENSMN